MTKNECQNHLDLLIYRGYSNEYIFSSFMYNQNDLDETLNNTMNNFINIISKDSKYIELQKINEAYIYALNKGENDISDIDKEKTFIKYIMSLKHVIKPEKFFEINNIFKRCYIRERKENAAKKGIELIDISGDEEKIDKNYRFTMPHNINPEYQYYSFTIETYSKLEELNSICHPLRNKRGLTKGEKKEKAYFEKKINELLEKVTVTDYEKMKLSKCMIILSKLEKKGELSEREKFFLEKLRVEKYELEKVILNRELLL